MIKEYIQAGYPLLWVTTHEEERAINTISQELEGYNIYSWDIVKGLQDYASGDVREMQDPLQPLQSILTLPEESIIFLLDFHRFIESVEVYRTVKNLTAHLKSYDKHIIFISPTVHVPLELQKDITVLEFPLPSREEIQKVAVQIITDNELEVEIPEVAISSAVGLTLHEAENALALSLVKEKRFSKKIIENEKLQAIKKSGLLELQNPEDIRNLGGLHGLKEYIQNRKKGFYDDTIPPFAKPHGIILVGPPGTGKSLSARVISSIFSIPLVRLDINSLKGSLVGESERNMNEALKIIKSVSPCVVWLDEFEKTFAGVASSARTDGGTTLGMIGKLLTAMQDFRDEGVPVYWIATVNDIDALIESSQGAIVRRFDDVFFIDFPSTEEKKEIIKIMNTKYGVQIPLELADKMENWTGAEIEKLAFSSLYDGLDTAFQAIRPIYHQCRESIEKARRWAKDNARPANGKRNKNKEGRRVKV